MFNSMKKIISSALMIGASVLVLTTSCKKEEPTLGAPPTAADAAFTYQPSTANANIIEFKASNSSLQATWELGNGQTANGTNVTGTYPFAGSYTVKLTVQNSGGSASSTQVIVIAVDDPSLISNPLFSLLTGGTSKTWAVDSVSAGHFGVGPAPSHPDFDGYYPKWYAAASEEKTGAGMYDDRYTFKIQGFGFDMITNGDVYVNSAHAGIAPFDDTTATNVGDFKANFPNQLGETWLLTEGADTMLTVSGNSMIGYWAGTRTYKIVEIDTNRLVLGYQDAANADLFWYVTLIPDGFISNPPPPPATYALPLDFEVIEPEFTVFGNSTYAFITNPDMSGINTSGKVLETVHGNETWAGLFVNLTNKLDFSTQTSIKIKVWAPAAGAFRLKLEERANTNNFVEVDVNVTTANTWEEITFDMTGTPADYDRLVIFPGWNVANAGTFYIDDIKQQ
jgi:PKD repeat protein